MTKTLVLVLSYLLGSLMITACTSASEAIVPTPMPSSTPRAVAEIKSRPTPAPLGQMVIYDDLQVMMKEAEVTTSYETEYGSKREPTAGKKFIWIRILLQNISQSEQTLPATEHFSILYDGTEFKSTYGHHKDYTDYTSLNTNMSMEQEVDAWLRFDIPANAELQDMQFAFLPESLQVSFDFSSSDYTWADHPIYLWNCAP